jgi:N-acetylglucosaminyldiphosphoundecaprenol N-acetyl-beta-D-mannosaminyltransferase
LAARINGHHPPARSTWADFGWPLLELCCRNKFKVFFFGCAPGIAEQAKIAALERYPLLNIVGVEHGFIDWKNQNSMDNTRLIDSINQSGADILIIGLGMPRQEQWILDQRKRLNVKVIMTGGAVFNYLSGKERRAPAWMLNAGLEWLFRFALEPRRLFRRYIIGNPLFLWRVLKQRFGIDKHK